MVALARRSTAARGRRRPDEPIAGWYAWRLMSSNNRRLASGVTSFASRLLAVDAVATLRANRAQLKAQVAIDPGNGAWRWRAELDGATVAVCPHRYERERDCRGGFAKFVTALPHADVAAGAIVLRDHTATVPRHRPVDLGRPTPWPTY